MTNSESLSLKWGTIKSIRWKDQNSKACKLFAEYCQAGETSNSAIMQQDNEEQKQIVLKLIDSIECDKIYLDWGGKFVTKEAAKKYVLEYGKK